MAILIVDDNPRMREMIRAIVAPVDHEVHECTDGADALELYRRLRPGWVLMDIAMERMDGLAATRAIRDADPAARIVVVTEHMEPALRRAAEEAGASAYVLKEDLSALLRVLDPGRSLHRALQASEDRYRTLFDRVPIGLYRSTPDGEILDANLAMVELLGCRSRDEVLSASALEFYVDPAERMLWQQLMAREGVVRDFESRLRRGDGQVIWVRHSARVVLDDRGHPLCYEGAVQDVTERRRAEERLRLSETRYRILYEENPSMYFTVDPAGTVLSVNAFGAGQLGYRAAELLGRPVLRVIHPDDRATAQAQLSMCAAHPGRIYGWEFRKVRKDGSVLWVKEIARAAQAPEGLVVFIVCEDVTERKQAEELLRRSETMAATGALVLGVAHEVRNPLHSITSAIDVLEMRSGVPLEARESVEVLRGQVERLQRLMHDLLAFGRPAPLELAAGSLEPLLDEAIAACAGVLGGGRVLKQVASPLPPVSMDHGRIVQVFTNLLDNALAHAPPGTAVRVTARPSPDGRWVECEVGDEGPGFAPRDLPRVFEPFFTRRAHGTGLGLSIVQRIVDQHHGEVEALNAAAGGAIVRVRLPVTETPGAVATPPDAASHRA